MYITSDQLKALLNEAYTTVKEDGRKRSFTIWRDQQIENLKLGKL